MASQIDAVTGLPTFAADEVISQIPLGQQVFPFADLDATGRMTRIPLYGEDVIPTSALITGQDSNGTPRAGTMTNDQALRVNIANVNPLTSSPSVSFNTGGFNSTNDSFTVAPGTFAKPRFIWGFLFWVQLLDFSATTPQSIGFTFAVQSNPSTTRFGFATGVLNYRNPSQINDNAAYISNIWLPNPLDMSKAFPASDTTASVGIATIAGLNCACSIVYE